MEPTQFPAPQSEQTWETSNISLARWLLPLGLFLGLGLLFAAHLPRGSNPWVGVLGITALIAWPILGFITAVQSVRFFFRSKGFLSKLAIAALTLTAFVANWIAWGTMWHIGPG